jgi:ferredoxin
MPRVSIYGTAKVFEIEEDGILYDSLLDQGQQLPHGCLSGSCGACRVEVMEGAENLQSIGAIETDTVDAIKDELIKTQGLESVDGKVIRLSCRAKVKGDVVFRPLK